ncbi:MAG: hypothetical protein GF416_06200 [Candidatus Altiarchaeales archaeon]|nr:hypothetical protein [Candidatus Altiarchaeales archaeon]MBD3416707.1 hypothetical protein [Candidatus Altiarchaeales archaeon]
MRWILALAGMMLLSGCICCGGLGGGDTVECDPPYMEYGTGCCLDANGNSVCDGDETVDTTVPSPPTLPPETLPPSTNPPQTTIATTSSTQPTELTVPLATMPPSTLKATYNCVKNAGYNPDHFFFLYSRGCGSKYTDEARTASYQKGVDVTLVDIGMLEPEEIQMMECFYGTYTEGNPTFGECPKLLCPKTGAVEVVTGRPAVLTQMRGFAVKCS